MTAEPTESADFESLLKFEHADLYTAPYELRRFLLWYTGAALMAPGYYLPLPVSSHLHVPPNVAAVVTIDSGARLALRPGRHWLSRVLKRADPVSVQFVNMKRLSFALTGLKIKTWDQLELEADFRMTVAVSAPERVTEWQDPLADVQSVFRQAVVRMAANHAHEDCLRKMSDLLAREVQPAVEQSCAARGLALAELLATRVAADKQYADMQRAVLLDVKRLLAEIDKQEQEQENSRRALAIKEAQTRREHDLKMKELELRAKEIERERAVQLQAAQMDEDVFALKQPGLRRKIMGEINSQLREQNFQARLKAIEAVGEVARALLEDIRHHPGRLSSPEETQTLLEALRLLENLSRPAEGPKIPQQVRSEFAIDDGSPKPPKLPVVLPDKA